MSKHSVVFTANAEVDIADIIEYVSKECAPDDVFDLSELEAWAQSNGWVKEDE